MASRVIDMQALYKDYIVDRAYVVGGQIVPEQEYWRIVREYEYIGIPLPADVRVINYLRKIEDDPCAIWET